MKILVIEDNRTLAALMKRFLEMDQFYVEVARDGESGFKVLKEKAFDLIIVDLVMPGRSGFDIIKAARLLKIDSPILVVSAKSSVEDKVKALNLGADDYLVKSFSVTEFRARVQVLLRRKIIGISHNIMACKDLILDLGNCSVKRAKFDIKLTKKELNILILLLKNKGNLVKADLLISKIWPESINQSISNRLGVHIKSLRQKIDYPFASKMIQTIRGRGYLITE